MVFLKVLFLFLGVLFSSTNLAKVYYKEVIPSGNFFLMTLGIVGFIVLQYGLY